MRKRWAGWMLAVLPFSAAATQWSGNAAVTSNYVSRGFEQSWGKPVLQGGWDVSGDSGWYAGMWGSGVSSRFIEGGWLEWDSYVGYAGSQGDFDWRAGVYYYAYPGARMSATNTRYNYGEVIVAGQWRWLEVSYATTWTRDYFGYNSRTLGIGTDLNSRGSGYLQVNGSWDLAPDWNLKLHAGHQRVRNFSAYNWRDASVSLSHQWRGNAISLSYARAWNSRGVYDQYTTGVADGAGNLHVGTPINGALSLTFSRSFEF